MLNDFFKEEDDQRERQSLVNELNRYKAMLAKTKSQSQKKVITNNIEQIKSMLNTI